MRDLLRANWRTKPVKRGFLLLAPDGSSTVLVHGTPQRSGHAVAKWRAEVRRAMESMEAMEVRL